MVRRNIGILLCILALTLGGCRGEDSGAYDRGMQALASADYETAMGEFQKAANEDGRKAEAYRGEMCIRDSPSGIPCTGGDLPGLPVVGFTDEG